MSNIVKEVELLTLRYAREGGKKNRRIQRKRMIIFAEFAAGHGCRSLAQVGRRQVESFFAANSSWSGGTRYGYELAIRELFSLAGKKVEVVSR